MLFLSLSTPIVITIVAIVAVQYAFATFCLLKLAYLDISKREYTLWNLFILLIFFIGGTAFLVYYHKVKDEKRIPPMPDVQSVDNAQTATDGNGAEGKEVNDDKADNAEAIDDAEVAKNIDDKTDE